MIQSLLINKLLWQYILKTTPTICYLFFSLSIYFSSLTFLSIVSCKHEKLLRAHEILSDYWDHPLPLAMCLCVEMTVEKLAVPYFNQELHCKVFKSLAQWQVADTHTHTHTHTNRNHHPHIKCAIQLMLPGSGAHSRQHTHTHITNRSMNTLPHRTNEWKLSGQDRLNKMHL